MLVRLSSLRTRLALRLAVIGILPHKTLRIVFRRLYHLGRSSRLPADLDLLLWQCASAFHTATTASAAFRSIETAGSRQTQNDIATAQQVPPALRLTEWQIAGRRLPYDAVRRSLNWLATDGTSDPLAIANLRLLSATIYKQLASTVDALLSAALALDPQLSSRALTILATTAQYPDLRAAYLPTLTRELAEAVDGYEEPPTAITEPLRFARLQLGQLET